jgi:hypothetical protein
MFLFPAGVALIRREARVTFDLRTAFFFIYIKRRIKGDVMSSGETSKRYVEAKMREKFFENVKCLTMSTEYPHY